MILRQARTADAAEICDIWNAIIRDTLVTFTTEEKDETTVAADIAARGPAFLVAETDGRVLGFASYGRFRAGPGYAHTREHSIQLAPKARGHGIGRKLMERLLDTAVADGVHVMVAGISSAAPESIAFHQALGFQETARMPEVGRKREQWLDLILMQKILHPDPDTTRVDA